MKTQKEHSSLIEEKSVTFQSNIAWFLFVVEVCNKKIWDQPDWATQQAIEWKLIKTK